MWHTDISRQASKQKTPRRRKEEKENLEETDHPKCFFLRSVLTLWASLLSFFGFTMEWYVLLFLREREPARDSKTSYSSVVLCYRVTCEKDRKLSAVVQKSFARRSFFTYAMLLFYYYSSIQLPLNVCCFIHELLLLQLLQKQLKKKLFLEGFFSFTLYYYWKVNSSCILCLENVQPVEKCVLVCRCTGHRHWVVKN